MTTLPQSTTDGYPDGEDDQYLDHPDDAYPTPDRQIPASAALVRAAIDSLQHVEEFLRHYANPSVHDDLRAYAQAQRWHPGTGPEAFLDGIALDAHSLTRALHATGREESNPPPPVL